MQEVIAGVEIPQTISIRPRPDNVKIAGVDVSCTSAISVLKAACGMRLSTGESVWEQVETMGKDLEHLGQEGHRG